ncbi:MAG: radical SAM family heme chaperone HemW [Sodalis sp. (in: enterobacteria)]
MSNLPPLSLYVHIPWCVQKCPYCDFNAYALNGQVSYQEYIGHLLSDFDYDIPLAFGRIINTIFIGGGTPSLLSISAMQTLLNSICRRLPVSQDVEITMEANPGVLEADRFEGYQQAGINRISIGIQSFNPEKLSSLGRIHSAQEARCAARLVARLDLHSFNFDLMHGLPNQSLADAFDDLAQAIAFNPPHLSWYQLTIEPNTLFGSQPPALPHDDMLWNIYQHGNRLLTATGYLQYEISSYAYPGFQCRHNLNYWRFGDYIGIGCGAHGKLTQMDGTVVRTVKTCNPYSYMQGNYLTKQYQIAPVDLSIEYFMNRFRLLETVPRIEFTTFTGQKETAMRPALDQALADGYITESDSHWQVTEKGKLFLNSLLELFM